MTPDQEEAIAELVRRGEIAAAKEAYARLQMTHKPAPQVPPGVAKYLPDSLGSMANAGTAAATGVGKFLGGAMDLPMDFLQGLENVTAGGPFGPAEQQGPKVATATGGLKKLFPETAAAVEGQSPGQKLISAGVEGGLAFAAPGRWVSELGGIVSSIAELAKQQAESPAAKRIALVLGLSPMVLQARTPRDAKALQAALKELGPDELAKMKAFSEAATRRLDTHISPLTAVPANTELATVFENLAKSPQGAQMRQQLGREQAAGGARVQDLVGQLTGAATDQGGANQVAAALLKAEKEPYGIMQEVAGPLFERGGQVVMPQGGTGYIAEAIRRAATARNAGPTSKAGKAAEKSARAVEDTVTELPILKPDGTPFTREPRAGELDTLKKEASDAAAAGALPMAPPGLKSKRAVNLSTEGILREETSRASPALELGRELYKIGHDTLVRPMRQSPLEGLISQESRVSGRGDWANFGKLFDSTKMGPKDIQDIASRVARQDPEAFPLMVKQNLEAKLASSTTGNFAESVLGKAGEYAGKREENFRESIRQVQLARGASPQAAAEAADGAVKLLTVVRDLEAGKLRLDGKALSEMDRVAGGNKISDLLRVINPFSGTVRTWAEAGPLEKRLIRKVYAKLAKTLSEPGGMDRLIEMSKYSPTAEATKIVGRLMVGEEIVE
jgi:hypothetical protein